MELLRPSEAAKELGVSYPTLKQWIYRGRLQSVTTPGGHHRIPRREIDRISREGARGPSQKRKRGDGTRISGRNKLRGRVVDVRHEGLLSQIQIDVGGQNDVAEHRLGGIQRAELAVNHSELLRVSGLRMKRDVTLNEGQIGVEGLGGNRSCAEEHGVSAGSLDRRAQTRIE